MTVDCSIILFINVTNKIGACAFLILCHVDIKIIINVLKVTLKQFIVIHFYFKIKETK